MSAVLLDSLMGISHNSQRPSSVLCALGTGIEEQSTHQTETPVYKHPRTRPSDEDEALDAKDMNL